MSMSTNRFWKGFIKSASMVKGERADKPEGAKPRTLVASKGRVDPKPLPSADDDSVINQHLRAELKFKTIPHIRKDRL